MKTLLLAALLLSGGAAQAQKVAVPAAGQESTQAFKGANTILIRTSDSARVAYGKMAQVLLSENYAIDRADKELLFLTTKPRSASKYNVLQAVKMSIRQVGSGAVIQLAGSFTAPAAAALSPFMAGETVTAYRGEKGSAIMVCWADLLKLAQSYPNSQLSYKKL